MTVADRIKQRREELHLTQTELAERLGYTGKSSISKIETSGDNISLKKIKRVAEGLNTTHAYLMGWTDDVTGYKSKVEKTPSNKVTFDCEITKDDNGKLLMKYRIQDTTNTRTEQRLKQYASMLLKSCNSLNEEGMNKLMNYADDLVSSNKYKKGE